MLEKYKDNPEITAEEISDCYDDVTELKDNGKLFTADKYKDLAFDFKKRNTVIKALCLHIAHTCILIVNTALQVRVSITVTEL